MPSSPKRKRERQLTRGFVAARLAQVSAEQRRQQAAGAFRYCACGGRLCLKRDRGVVMIACRQCGRAVPMRADVVAALAQEGHADGTQEVGQAGVLA